MKKKKKRKNKIFFKKHLQFGKRFDIISKPKGHGRLAQLVEHLLDVQRVRDSSSLPSTKGRQPMCCMNAAYWLFFCAKMGSEGAGRSALFFLQGNVVLSLRRQRETEGVAIFYKGEIPLITGVIQRGEWLSRLFAQRLLGKWLWEFFLWTSLPFGFVSCYNNDTYRPRHVQFLHRDGYFSTERRRCRCRTNPAGYAKI